MKREIAALCLSAVALAGSARAELDGTLRKIHDTGVFVVGHRELSVPFSYVDADRGGTTARDPVGFAIDLCAVVADAIRAELKLPALEVRYKPVTSDNRIPLLRKGEIDIECGSTSNTVARQQQVSFSVSYFVASVRMLVRRDFGIKNFRDLDGRRVAMTAGTTADELFAQQAKAESVEARIVYGEDHDSAFRMVESGRASAFVLDDVLLAGLIAVSRNPQALAIVGRSLRDEPYGLMLPKGDLPFKALVDRTLIGLMKSGEAEELYEKWFTKPIGSRKVNLNFPISADLRAAFDKPTDRGAD